MSTAPWRVAEFWSSARPKEKVLALAVGDDIEMWAGRHDFIRWVDRTEEEIRNAALEEAAEFCEEPYLTQDGWGTDIAASRCAPAIRKLKTRETP